MEVGAGLIQNVNLQVKTQELLTGRVESNTFWLQYTDSLIASSIVNVLGNSSTSIVRVSGSILQDQPQKVAASKGIVVLF